MHRIIHTHQQFSLERPSTQEDSNETYKVTLGLLDTINHISSYVFFHKVNKLIRVHTIPSTPYITLKSTLHLRSVNWTNYHVLTQFQISVIREVAKVKSMGIHLTIRLNTTQSCNIKYITI